MELLNHKFYHIKNEFFDTIDVTNVPMNYENYGYRPHFLATKDDNNPDIYWMIPVSSKYDKYKVIHDRIADKFGSCTKIVLGKCGRKDAAFLVQNAFPITADFIDHIHLMCGKPMRMHKSTARRINECLNFNFMLYKKGFNLFYTDVEYLLKQMEKHLSDLEEAAKKQAQMEQEANPMVVNEQILENIENRKLRNQVLRQIKKIYDGDRVSDVVQHYTPSKDEEINIMAVPFHSKVDHILNQLQEAGVFESWENKTEDNDDPAFCFYNVNRNFWDNLDDFLKEERQSGKNRNSTVQSR